MGSVELVVALAHETEGILVIAEPHVQPVLLDAPVRTPAARAFAAETPTALVHRDGIDAVTVLGPAELPRRGETGDPAPQYHDAGERGNGVSLPFHDPSSDRV